MDLIAPLSVEEIQTILNDDPAAVYRTVKAVTVSKDGEVSHTIAISNQDLISIFESVASDPEDARQNTIEIEKGVISSSRTFPFIKEILGHVGQVGGPIPASVSRNLRPAICSFIIHRFGNKKI